MPGVTSVLATVGGGEDGKHILELFIEASAGGSWDGVLVTGTIMPANDRAALARMAADAGLEFHVFLSGLTQWYEQADAVVCMGGYNTLAEALFTGVPTVCIPRVRPRKEQLMRATALAKLGLLELLDPDKLTVSLLRETIASTTVTLDSGNTTWPVGSTGLMPGVGLSIAQKFVTVTVVLEPSPKLAINSGRGSTRFSTLPAPTTQRLNSLTSRESVLNCRSDVAVMLCLHAYRAENKKGRSFRQGSPETGLPSAFHNKHSRLTRRPDNRVDMQSSDL